MADQDAVDLDEHGREPMGYRFVAGKPVPYYEMDAEQELAFYARSEPKAVLHRAPPPPEAAEDPQRR